MSEITGKPVALILGATGGVGGAVARALLARGYHIRALNRDPARWIEKQPHYEWLKGDAMRREDVETAARGAELIFHGVNPPGYKDWDKLVLPMLENTIAAARLFNARILFPATIYNFGRDVFPSPSEDSPQNPTTRKGRIRVAMEDRLKEAAFDGTQVILVRAGDFFGGDAAGNSWFGQVVKPHAPLTRITNPATPGVGHQWAYLPDLAETFAALDERAGQLPKFANFQFEGFYDADGMQMVEAIRRVAGDPKLKIARFPWFVVPLLSPFMTLMREVKEVRYLWKEPLHMKNDKLVAFLGHEPRTPLDTAIGKALDDIGVTLPRSSASDILKGPVSRA
ncbi:NAD(P)H-binding protein [Martelella soudanensis]|uniref:NAD(P)H-binding protein n=1 Tax=unclassified Martelella TaxID=2629616 RepID=UPI0015DFEFC9|nr:MULTISPECIES: NAD(P)H-binding protein [unclassified Martelella]